ncbi:outer membrane beta-barrel protein [Mucilaginibacter rigui]|uniref:Outer membrane beta-barrel protein n=1 Tax=Mucilaginibacter rigui TaxID=534635 RepID=A0ABR7X5S3_9SPHI|nr:outer membrane beta-barrel protein [Mucilaginibacter rigui]MBD1385934.1 outer membrane beta-barrel protein [Mucilaginibacter rigui]
MKTSIKISLILLSLFGITPKANAQTSPTKGLIKLSIGAESGISLGDFKNAYKANVGGSVQADLALGNNFHALLNTGYMQFLGKDNAFGAGLSANDLHYLPVMTGIKYFPNAHFYLQAAAGAAFALNKSDVGFSKTAGFLYVPQAGYEFPLSKNSFIDAGIRYEATTKFISNNSASKINFIGLRVAYGFNL